jgi:hypothetical protein
MKKTMTIYFKNTNDEIISRCKNLLLCGVNHLVVSDIDDVVVIDVSNVDYSKLISIAGVFSTVSFVHKLEITGKN